MALAFPYTYISCPCSDSPQRVSSSKRASRDLEFERGQEEEEKPFDPHHPRSAFSLYPPDHLLYCEECHDLKCPRCVTEEIVSWYCSSCLFETPSSSVRAEGNRCARNCFDCPICTSSLVTAPIGEGKETQYILNCNYCMWNTLDIGIKFDKPTNIRQQLDSIANGGIPRQTTQRKKSDAIDRLLRSSSLVKGLLSPTIPEDDSDPMDKAVPQGALDPTARFSALRAFYKEQIAASSEIESGGGDLSYSSPSSLARIMSLYSKTGSTTARSRQKVSVMREAMTAMEGLQLADPPVSKSQIPEYNETVSDEQQSFQHPSFLGDPNTRDVSELRPMPSQLRTKRSKRCTACKHILVKPEFKATSVRYRIKLIALNYIPMTSLKPLPVPGGLHAMGPDGGDVVLQPSKPSQWILTLKNPLFENVNVSLGTPSVTPGRHPHRVTILCPQFEIGKNGDVWDDALNNPNPLNKNLTASGPNTTGTAAAAVTAGGEQIAGKLYDQGRNWVSIVIELVPAAIALEKGKELAEDEDVIEIPIRVRLEWKGADEADAEGGAVKRKSEKVLQDEVSAADVDDGSRELSYWMVLGVGRVAT